MKLAVILISLILAVSCQNNNSTSKISATAEREGLDPKAELLASPHILKSFGRTTRDTNASNGANEDRYHVVIKKSALEKEFLLATSLIHQLPAPQFRSMQSLIVSFVKRNNKIYMNNVTGIHEIASNHNPQILAEFPIISEDTEQYEIDYNEGMKQLFTFSAPAETDTIFAEAGQIASDIKISYLDQVKLDNEILFIRQIAQIKVESLVVPVEVRYQLKAYRPDPSFVPVRIEDSTKVGYLPNFAPVLNNEGAYLNYAKKWHDKKKIKFALSANTPVEMRDTIKSGLLYWNRILGENKIEVIQLEDKNITAPQFDLNIVQWVDWENLGTAYADMQTDPRTGEILSANIFLPSGKPPVKASRSVLFRAGLKGFEPVVVCAPPKNPSIDQSNFQTITKRMTLNNLFVTIAHEMGHNLGLRHNFAGSLAASFDAHERHQILQNYYQTNTISSNLQVASTVMDYLMPDDKSLLAEVIYRDSNKVLAYDEMAIAHLYQNQPLPNQNRPFYCTNGQEEDYVDCQQFDVGRSEISYLAKSYQGDIKYLSRLVFSAYFPINPNSTNVKSVREVSINATAYANYVSDSLNSFALMLKTPQFISVRSAYMPVINTQRNEIAANEEEYLISEINRLGGLENLLQSYNEETFVNDFVNEFKQLTLLDTRWSNSLNSEDQEFILNQINVLAKQLKSKLLANEINILSGKNINNPKDVSTWSDNELTQTLSSINEKKFIKYVLSKKPEAKPYTLTLTDGTTKSVQLPTYAYNDYVRGLAANLLNGPADSGSWAFTLRVKAIKSIDAEMAILGDMSKVDTTKLPTEVIDWILSNQAILKTLKDGMPK